MSHTPTLERISQALEPIFPIELRFTDYTRPEAGRAPAAGSLYHLFVISRRFEGLPKIDRHRIVYEYLKPFIGHGIHQPFKSNKNPAERRSCTACLAEPA